jgi:2-polyprenyl-6-methoxyphenol hydroxylase-like FAD-dependent oxidoreductase
MIIITTSALHTPKKWPGFMERARKRAIPPTLTMKKFNGDVVGSFNLGDKKNPSMAIYRSELHKVLHEYASLLGIPIEFSTHAVDYFEIEDHGGVELADGRKLTADIVVAADGVGSKSWHLVGEKTAPISSGFVLYRVTFPAVPALENPTIRNEFEGVGDRGILHAGPGAHMVTCLSGDKMCWMLTCKVSFLHFLLSCRAESDGEGRTMATKVEKAGLSRHRSTKLSKRPVAGSRLLPKSSKLRLATLFLTGN